MSVDPMTMMESLKSKKKKKKKNGDGSDWTWKELSDLVKYSPVMISLYPQSDSSFPHHFAKLSFPDSSIRHPFLLRCLN